MGLIDPTAVIWPGVELGENVQIGPYAVIGAPGEARHPVIKPSGRVRIGDNTVISEHARIQSGINGTTEVGANCLIMGGGHISHDCHLGDFVTTAANIALGGHTTLEDFVFVGTSACTHQEAVMLEGSLLGSGSFLKGTADEWEIYVGSPAKSIGINRIGRNRYEQGYYQ